ncbi:MAG: hypothetical protein MK008_01530 [Bdellovibrionales bacterium]|nr:hypothetical protein [Bdellovibrionales bacterium]
MTLIITLLLSFTAHAQVDTQKTNLLLKSILPAEYELEVASKISESEYMFVPQQKNSRTNLLRTREGTLLSDNVEDLEDSNVIVQSLSKGGAFFLYAAQKEDNNWNMYRYTDGNFSDKQLTFCETQRKPDKETKSIFGKIKKGFKAAAATMSRTDIHCVAASERICRKPLSEWPQGTKISKVKFSEFLGSDEGGINEYIQFSWGQSTSLRDRMSNIYKIDNFEVKNRIKEAYEMDDGFEGDAVRGAVVAQVKSLCAKAWPKHKMELQGIPVKGKKRGAPSLQKTNQGVR